MKKFVLYDNARESLLPFTGTASQDTSKDGRSIRCTIQVKVNIDNWLATCSKYILVARFDATECEN